MNYEVEYYELKSIKDMNTDNLKRYTVSSAVTFVSSFLLVFCVAIQDSAFTFSSASFASLISAASISGVRAVAKMVVELIINNK